MADWVKFDSFADGQTKRFMALGPCSYTPYEYDNKKTDQWTIPVREMPGGEDTELRLSPKMHDSIKAIENQIASGVELTLTRHTKSKWESVIVSASTSAPPATQSRGSAGRPPPSAVRHGEFGARYDKYSSPVLTRDQMEAMAEWAMQQTAAAALKLGLIQDGMARDAAAVQSMFATFVIMAQNCGIPEEFGASLRTRDDMSAELNAAVRERKVDREAFARWICETYAVDSPQQISTEHLREVTAGLDATFEMYADWLAAQQEPVTADQIPF